MLIGALAKTLGVTSKTLRHYERIGLVPAAERRRNGYRTYSTDAVRRARLVVGLRALGLSLDAIRELLVDDGRPLRSKLLGLLDEQLRDHALQIAILQGRHDDLEARYHALLLQPDPVVPDCICAALMRMCDCAPAVPARPKRSAAVARRA
jgi:DNA-binding transcriptional MerR regulator